MRVAHIFHVDVCVQWPKCHQPEVGATNHRGLCVLDAAAGETRAHTLCESVCPCVVSSKQQARAGGSQVLEQP